MKKSVNYGFILSGIAISLIGVLFLIGWMDWIFNVFGFLTLAVGLILLMSAALFRQISTLIVGVVVSLFGIIFMFGWMDWIFDVSGFIFLALGIILFIAGIFKRKKNKHENRHLQEIIIDEYP